MAGTAVCVKCFFIMFININTDQHTYATWLLAYTLLLLVYIHY